MTDLRMPSIRYARCGPLSIAYATIGEGPDIVVAPSFTTNVELTWSHSSGDLFRGLASFARVTVFDKRGTGLSDREFGAATLEDRMDDLRAVMDAAGIERATIMGMSEGGPMSLLFAATHPERVSSLVLLSSYAWLGVGSAPEPLVTFVEEQWGTGEVMLALAPGASRSDAAREQAARWERNSATPKVAAELMQLNFAIDVRHILPVISAPALVVHCDGDVMVQREMAEELVRDLPVAKAAWIDDAFHGALAWDPSQYVPVLDAVQEFMTGRATDHEPDRVLKTVLYTDIVDSTQTAVGLGDARWHEVLDTHDAVVRRELAYFRGVELKHTGDGFLAAFDGPARAIRCARAVVEAARRIGIEVRAGLHSGECEQRGDDLAGIALHIGARVAGRAGPGEVLVSATVRDLVAGSGIAFEDRGEHELKGLPEKLRLLAVSGA